MLKVTIPSNPVMPPSEVGTLTYAFLPRRDWIVKVMMGSALAVAAAAQNIAPLSPEMRAAMTGKSWRTGCPVTLDDLDTVRVKYFDFDGRTEEGTLVVHGRVAEDVARIFASLYKARFPVRKISQWEKYGPGKYAEQDVTVGFYCEKADDAPGEWSSHAYGVAIDLNPLENPFRQGEKPWWPKGSAEFARRDGGKGKIGADSVAVRSFTHYGWSWGGAYQGETDYMHFYKKIDPRTLR